MNTVQRFAVDDEFDPGAMEWAIALEHEGSEYRWEGCTAHRRFNLVCGQQAAQAESLG